jgi:flavin-dependent dehydrogenase
MIFMSKTTTHDVIVIGAVRLGRVQLSFPERAPVLLLEREKFPREHVGESLLPFCYPLLQDLGVIDQLKKNFVRKPGVRFIDRGGNISTTWCFDHVIKDETYLSFQVIRGEFDHILLKNAAKNGAEVREETTVTGADITSASDQVTVTSLDSTGRETCIPPVSWSMRVAARLPSEPGAAGAKRGKNSIGPRYGPTGATSS